MGQDGKGKEGRKKRHEHKYEAEQEKARGDRPAGGHRNGNHTSLWTTATDLPAGGYHMAWRMLGYTNGCQCRHIHLPYHGHDNFDASVFRPIGQQALMTFLCGAKSVMGTCGRCIPWFDAPRSYRGVKNEASRD